MSSKHRQNVKSRKNTENFLPSARIGSEQRSRRRSSLHVQVTPSKPHSEDHPYTSPDMQEESTELPESIENCKRITKTLKTKINHSLSLFKEANSRYLHKNRGETFELVCMRKDLQVLSNELDEINEEKDKSLKGINEIKFLIRKGRDSSDEKSDLHIFSKICQLKAELSQLKERLNTAESNIHQTEPDYINIVENFTQEIVYEKSEEPTTCKCVIS